MDSINNAIKTIGDGAAQEPPGPVSTLSTVSTCLY